MSRAMDWAAMCLGRRRYRRPKPDASAIERERASAYAAVVAGTLLCMTAIAALPPPPSQKPALAICRQPRELAAEAGWTIDVDCGTPTDGASQPARPLRGPARLLFGQTLDLNCADPLALQSLPSIGPSRAEAIAVTRAVRVFSSLQDLERVPGIGPKTVGGLLGWAHVADPVPCLERGASSAELESSTEGALVRGPSGATSP
jgi:hypothetical protein